MKLIYALKATCIDGVNTHLQGRDKERPSKSKDNKNLPKDEYAIIKTTVIKSIYFLSPL